MQKRMIPGFSARWLLKTVKHFGVTQDKILAGTGLDQNWQNAPEGRLSYAQYIQMANNALDITGDPALGIKIGEFYNLADYGVWGYAIISSSTLGEALAISEKFWDLNGALVNPVIKTGEEDIFIEIFPAFTCQDERMFIFAVEEYISTVVASAKFLSRQSMPMKEVHLSYQKPEYASIYTELFEKAPCFNASSTWCRFSKDLLKLPTVMGHPTMKQICINHCEEILRVLRKSDRLVDEIRQHLISSLGKYPSIEGIARQLNMSERTLSRRLKERRTSYQQILNEVRAELSKEYLANTILSIAQVSTLVGFSEPNTFSKAFKKWFGKTPSVLRKELRS